MSSMGFRSTHDDDCSESSILANDGICGYHSHAEVGCAVCSIRGDVDYPPNEYYERDKRDRPGIGVNDGKRSWHKAQCDSSDPC